MQLCFAPKAMFRPGCRWDMRCSEWNLFGVWTGAEEWLLSSRSQCLCFSSWSWGACSTSFRSDTLWYRERGHWKPVWYARLISWGRVEVPSNAACTARNKRLGTDSSCARRSEKKTNRRTSARRNRNGVIVRRRREEKGERRTRSTERIEREGKGRRKGKAKRELKIKKLKSDEKEEPTEW